MLRPEGGTYTANHAAVNTMFNMQLHDRSGKAQYTDVSTGEMKPPVCGCVRQVATKVGMTVAASCVLKVIAM